MKNYREPQDVGGRVINHREPQDVGGRGRTSNATRMSVGLLPRPLASCFFLLVLFACGEAPAAKPESAAAPGPVAVAPIASESTPAPVDLSKLQSNIPKASTDTFTFRPLRVEQIPDAPQPLMDAAERERGISRFCYQEFGQKVNPKLTGAVALIVTLEANVITAARIGADDWNAPHGKAVNRCLVQKVPQAWKLAPDADLKDGRYVLQLQFRPS